jgi:hypothetical protein
MRVIKSNVAIIVIVAITSIVCVAQTIPEPSQLELGSAGGGYGGGTITPRSLPIYSQDIVREYGLSIAVRGYRSVNAESLDRAYDGITYTNVQGKGAEDILDKLFAVQFIYRLTNPADEVRGDVYLYDQYDNVLFYGNAMYAADSLGKVNPVYSIWMQKMPMLNDVQSAEILATDPDGSTAKRISVEIRSGQLLFDPWMAGSKNGILVVRFINGTILTYPLAKPIGVAPATTGEMSSYNIQDHYVVNGPVGPEGYTLPLTLKVIALWNRPTAYLRATNALELSVDVTGVVQDGQITFERPASMVIWQEGKEKAFDPIPLNGDKPTPVSIPVGNFRIRFTWTKFGQPGLLYTGPEGPVGEKG